VTEAPGGALSDPLRAELESRLPWLSHGVPWSVQSLGTGPAPDQGWKLHLSATPRSALRVLRRALPILLARGTPFKVVNSLEGIGQLNSGEFGGTQVGKFLTAYPSDDAEAVALAGELHLATEGLAGPRVPSDRPLVPGSLVHYRYGAFWPRRPASEDADTEHLYDLLDDGGRLIQDFRLPFYRGPGGVTDPFEAADVYAPQLRDGPLGGRFLVHESLGRSWRGGVYRAIDLGSRPARLCVLKITWHDVGPGPDGDAQSWAHHEADLLEAHDSDPFLPRCFGRYILDRDLYLILEHIDGRSLAGELSDSLELANGIDVDELVAWARSTAQTLAHLHGIGIVFRDFKPENIVHTVDGTYRLVDFGAAKDSASVKSPPWKGTPAYTSPEQWSGEPAAPSADVFAWGAVLHQLSCGWQSIEPGSEALQPCRRQPVRDLRPSLPGGLAEVIDRALSWNAADRYPSMIEGLAALEASLRRPAVLRPAPVTALLATEPPQPAAPPSNSTDFLELALEVADALCEDAVKADGRGCFWPVSGEGGRTHARPDLYDGAAGIGLFLAMAAQTSGRDRYAQRAREAAAWLAGPTWSRGRAAAGLHCGDAGVALFFLRLASLLEEPGYVAAALLRARRLEGVPFETLDLVNGAAGSAILQVALLDVAGDEDHLRKARAAGDLLVRRARPAPPGRVGVYWDVASPDPTTPARPFLGAAHGAAGIALSLCELARVSGDEAYLTNALAAAELLVEEAIIDEPIQWRWPATLVGSDARLQAWCHGAGGIGQLFCRLAVTFPDRSGHLLPALTGAAATLIAGIDQSEVSGLCCGLAGTGSHLLDSWHATGDKRYLDAARRCGLRLHEFADGPGRYRGVLRRSETAHGLFTGSAGVGAFFLRLAKPESCEDPVLPTPRMAGIGTGLA
jgi:hypothetical protein